MLGCITSNSAVSAELSEVLLYSVNLSALTSKDGNSKFSAEKLIGEKPSKVGAKILGIKMLIKIERILSLECCI